MRRCRGLLIGLIGCLTIAFVVFVSRPTNDIVETVKILNIETQSDAHLANNVQRSVTPSLAELGGRGDLPETNDHVLMITRIPGAGAELLVLILQRLQGYNAFKHIRLPPGDDGLLSSLQQELLVEEIISIIRQEAIPLTFDGDVRFLNFSAFARQAPSFVSLVRDPLDATSLQRLNNVGASSTYRGSISYFCGQNPRCTKRNDEWALKTAKENISRWYRTVGILDHMDETLEALEREFPYFFDGAVRIYAKIRAKSKNFDDKSAVKPVAERRLSEIFRDEIEFYQWLKFRLLNRISDNG